MHSYMNNIIDIGIEVIAVFICPIRSFHVSTIEVYSQGAVMERVIRVYIFNSNVIKTCIVN